MGGVNSPDINNVHKRKWEESIDGGKMPMAGFSFFVENSDYVYGRMSGNSNMQPSSSTAMETRHPNSMTTSSNFNNSYSSIVPKLTVEMDGRSICQLIDLKKLGCYENFAATLRSMFVDEDHMTAALVLERDGEGGCDLSNAIPGYRIAFYDSENDLLLAGDLKWRDFVREARRIRIMPVRSNGRRS